MRWDDVTGNTCACGVRMERRRRRRRRRHRKWFGKFAEKTVESDETQLPFSGLVQLSTGGHMITFQDLFPAWLICVRTRRVSSTSTVHRTMNTQYRAANRVVRFLPPSRRRGDSATDTHVVAVWRRPIRPPALPVSCRLRSVCRPSSVHSLILLFCIHQTALAKLVLGRLNFTLCQ